MTAAYFVLIAAGPVLAAAAYGLRLRKAGEGLTLWLWGAALGAALGLLCAKGGYFLLMAGREGAERALAFRYDGFSVVCGGAGVLGGIALSARMARRSPGVALDAFAPCGALLLACCRAAELFTGGLLGAGKAYLDEGHLLARFPLGLQNQWGDWFPAVCTLEAALALGAALFFFLKKNGGEPGKTWETAAFLLCLCQILLESLRGVCMKWGFVRVEQVLCGVIVFSLIARRCALARGVGAVRRWLPAAVTLVCVGGVAAMEFALDKGLLWLTYQLFRLPAVLEAPHIPHNTEICCGLMALFLAVMAWMEGVALRRGTSQEKAA